MPLSTKMQVPQPFVLLSRSKNLSCFVTIYVVFHAVWYTIRNTLVLANGNLKILYNIDIVHFSFLKACCVMLNLNTYFGHLAVI